MRFYRRLQPFKAISFDLDDTLYNNTPVMAVTEAKMTSYFDSLLSPEKPGSLNYDFWVPYRNEVLFTQPELSHDVEALRQAGYALGLQRLGYTLADSLNVSAKAQHYFNECRSDFSVPKASHELLKALQEKWPLIAISNGNANTKTVNIHHYFSKVYHAGNGLKQKPNPDMFYRACRYLAIKPHELLHVGDCGVSDIYGAHEAGCQSAWISTYNVGKPIKVLPHIALTDVTQLLQLI